MKIKNSSILFALLLTSACPIFSMEEPESWNCEILSFVSQLLKEAVLSVRFNCNQANAADKLFAAIRNQNVTEGATQISQLLSEHPQLLDVAVDDEGMTPLMAATIKGDAAIVAHLLNRIPQPQVDRFHHEGFAMNPAPGVHWLSLAGFTPLMAAAKYNRIDIAKQLLSAQANKELKDFSNPGKTALDYAKESGNIQMVSLLS
jgi:ankyrin repeat protein